MMQETTMHEDKQEICNKLGGHIQRINVEGDSGIAMINDVLKHIVF